MWRRMWRST
ncbi:hypothetical protein LINPERHAP1_LOCUS24830 [Linum perenne]